MVKKIDLYSFVHKKKDLIILVTSIGDEILVGIKTSFFFQATMLF